MVCTEQLLQPCKFAQGRIGGLGYPQVLQPVLPVFHDVHASLGVETHAVSADEAVHLPVICRTPLGDHVPLQIVNTDTGRDVFGHHLAAHRALSGHPEYARYEYMILLVEEYRLRTSLDVPDAQVLALEIEDLNPGILPVAHEDPAVGVDPDEVR